MRRKRSWSELSPAARAAVVAGGVVEVVVTAWCVRDLVRRPAAGVRGPKRLWALGFVVQPFGPVAYLLGGRRR
jgi:hypothetical protein